MSLADLLPSVQALSRPDKFRLVHILVLELAQEEGVPSLVEGASYPVWTPPPAFEAAQTLLRLLEEHKRAGNG
jgi:hypothetical protein